MNTLAGTIFVIILAFGWVMVLWWGLMVTLGMDIRRDMKNWGEDTPGVNKISFIVTSLLNLMTVAITVGCFFDWTYEFYVQHMTLMCVSSGCSVMAACLNNDHLHHQVLENISCYEGVRKKKADEAHKATAAEQDTDNNDIKNK